MYKQADVIRTLNRDIMTSNSQYCESNWYIGLGGNDLVSSFYTWALNVVINWCKLTDIGFLSYVDMAITPSLEITRINITSYEMIK